MTINKTAVDFPRDIAIMPFISDNYFPQYNNDEFRWKKKSKIIYF